jgi:hypothetical protein
VGAVRLVALGCLALVLALVLAPACVTAGAGAARAEARGPAPIYWGAYLGPGEQGEPPYDMRGADAFESLVGKRMSLLEFTQPWARCYTLPCRFLPFPRREMSAIRARGQIPVFGWASYSLPVSSSEPDFQLADIIDGAYDRFILRWARRARAWRHPFFLRFDPEMNLGGVWPYVEARNGNRPGQFVRMWRHVHRLFAKARANNVTWVWCPNVEYWDSTKPLKRLYPGRAYVDWTCVVGFNWGATGDHPSGWAPFASLFGSTYELITRRIAPRKPLMIADTGSSEVGGSKAEWIADMLGHQLESRFRKAGALIYFNRLDDGVDWRIESSPAASAAFGAGIRSSRFAGGRFGTIRGSPIRPPRP